MAQIEEDEDAFTGRRRLRRIRRPIDLSLGYYFNANKDVPMTKDYSNEDPSVRFSPPIRSNQDSHAEIVEPAMKENENMSGSDMARHHISESSDPISVDLFLKTTSKVNATKNYKQARKRNIKRTLTEVPKETGVGRDSCVLATLTAKPLKTAGRTGARHRAATRVLAVSGFKSRINLASPPSLHHLWQPVKKAHTSAVDNRLDTGMGGGLSTKSNPSTVSRVLFLPVTWNKAQPQSGTRVKASPKLPRVKAIPDAARLALTFEPIEEHDKKFGVWLESCTHGTKAETKKKQPFVCGVAPLSLTESVVSGNGQVAKNSPKTDPPVLGGNSVVSYAGSLASHPWESTASDNTGLKHAVGKPSRMVPGEKFTPLGDILGELRLSAKEFYHASGHVPSPA